MTTAYTSDDGKRSITVERIPRTLTLPLAVDEPVGHIIDAKGFIVAFLRATDLSVLPKAAYIVRATNCHEDLLAALWSVEQFHDGDADPEIKALLDIVRAAIAKAVPS